jgi:hypothetical protein
VIHPKLGGAQFALDDLREESADLNGVETESSEAKIPNEVPTVLEPKFINLRSNFLSKLNNFKNV